MERNNGFRIVIALLLIGFGGLVLLNNLNVLPFDITTRDVFWAVAFGAAAVTFLAVYATNTRENWWALIPGFTLLGLAILVANILPDDRLGGSLFLGMIGLSFWTIYATRREYWWAVIPGGVLLTLAVVAGVSDTIGGIDTGALFFLGLASTFFLVFMLPTPDGRMRWAIWPAAILGTMGLLLLLGASNMARYIWPLALILGGGLMMFRALGPRAR